jgi:hypothetical protein
VDCQQVLDSLDACLDDELSVEERDVIETHLKSCSTCRREADERRKQDRLLRLALDASTPSQESMPAPRSWSRRAWAFCIAAAAACVLLVLAVNRPKEPQDLQFRVTTLVDEMSKNPKEVEARIRSLGSPCCGPLVRRLLTDADIAPIHRRRLAKIAAEVGASTDALHLSELLVDGDGEIRMICAQGIIRMTGESGPMTPEQFRDSNEQELRNAQLDWKSLLAKRSEQGGQNH